MMSWLKAIWSLLSAVFGGTGQAAAQAQLELAAHELDRERGITAALRLRLVAKEMRIRELEKLVGERDPGLLLDSVFRDDDSDPKT